MYPPMQLRPRSTASSSPRTLALVAVIRQCVCRRVLRLGLLTLSRHERLGARQRSLFRMPWWPPSLAVCGNTPTLVGVDLPVGWGRRIRWSHLRGEWRACAGDVIRRQRCWRSWIWRSASRATTHCGSSVFDVMYAAGGRPPMGLLEPSFDPTVFTKNRRRLLRHEVAQRFFEEVGAPGSRARAVER
jgi:hypothetical protein